MASGSGKNQDGYQTKGPVECEEFTAAAAAAEPPSPAPPSERLQERAHGSPEDGGRNPSAATAAEAAASAQQKSTRIGAPSLRRHADGKPPLPPRAASVSRAREPKSAAGKPPLPPRASTSKGKKPMSDAEVVKSGMEGRAKWKDMREGRMYMKKLFDELLEESKATAEMGQKDEPEGTAMQQEQVKSAAIWPENYDKGSIWIKFLDRIGISDLNSRIANPDVNYEEFKKLTKKVMRWKRHSRWKHLPTTNSYHKKKLLQYFNSYVKTNDTLSSSQTISGERFADGGSNLLTVLPHDIMLEIFLRLPSDDIHRCRCVCQLWNKILNDRRFNRLHTRQWSSFMPIFFYQPGPLLDNPQNEDLSGTDLLGIDLAAREARPLLDFTASEGTDPNGICIHGSSEGVLLLSHADDLCLCNPLTCHWASLPPIHLTDDIIGFYNRNTGSSSKELNILHKSQCQEVQGGYFISTVGIQEVRSRSIGWPVMPGSLPELESTLQKLSSAHEGPPTLLNGKLHWLLPVYHSQTSRNFLVAFDVEKEEFQFLHTPEVERLFAYQVFEVNGCLAMAVGNATMSSVDIWLLLCEDDGMEAWSCTYTVHLPIADINSNCARDHLGEPIIYFVSEDMEFLLWCPLTLLQGSAAGATVQKYSHKPKWRMTVPHWHHENLICHPFLNTDVNVHPPFFRFLDM